MWCLWKKKLVVDASESQVVTGETDSLQNRTEQERNHLEQGMPSYQERKHPKLGWYKIGKPGKEKAYWGKKKEKEAA